MSKTNFVDGDPSRGILGTVVTADFLNALNKHYHTGLDQDGHGALPYAVDTGAANACVVTLNPALTQYVTGMPIFFKAANANTGASTVDVNALGAKTIKKNITQDLAAGDIQAGQIVMIIYDGVSFQLIGGLDAHTIDGYHASATPAANAVPVRKSSSPYAVANAELAMTGEASAYVNTNTPVYLDLGTVTYGDRILVTGTVLDIVSAVPSSANGSIYPSAGTATIQIVFTGAAQGDYAVVKNASNYMLGSGTFIVKVIGGGTLTLANTVYYSGGTFTNYTRGIYAFFLKKQ